MNQPSERSIGRRIARLEEIRNRYGPEMAKEKKEILGALGAATIFGARLLTRYHEALLFLRAYPDDEKIFRLVRRECDRFINRVAALTEHDPDEAEKLADSGIAGTKMYYIYDLITARLLTGWFGDDLEIDWEAIESGDPVDALLPLLIEWAENDGLDLADMTSDEWIALRKGGGGKSSYRWLVENIDKINAPPLVKRHLFDTLELPVVWELGESNASRTKLKVPSGAPFFHDRPLHRKVSDFRREITRPMADVQPESRASGKRLIRAVRSALAVRHRSLYPIEYASPDDVFVMEPGRGYRLILFGMDPAYRLPLESDYGALLVKNGYPVGYGVGAMLFDQMEIAVNIFDSWRGGEGGFIFTQFVRAFRAHFGCTRFKIVRYQVGHENDEGLKSGSFWFYYKLGFVPKDEGVRKLAAKEMAKIKKDRTYRSTIETLKKLAVSDLYLSLRDDRSAIPKEFPLSDLSVATTRMIGERFNGDGRRAREECADAAAKALGVRGRDSWPRWERVWFERLSLTVAQIDGLENWPAEEKKELVALIRAKGKTGETKFVRRSIGAKRFRRALEEATRKQ